MSHHTPSVALIARKPHRCTNCAEPILAGERYMRWVSFDGGAVTSKMHPECLKDLQATAEYGEFEYTLYGGERPEPDHQGTPK